MEERKSDLVRRGKRHAKHMLRWGHSIEISVRRSVVGQSVHWSVAGQAAGITRDSMCERFKWKANPFDWWQMDSVRKPLPVTVQLKHKKPQQQKYNPTPLQAVTHKLRIITLAKRSNLGVEHREAFEGTQCFLSDQQLLTSPTVVC